MTLKLCAKSAIPINAHLNITTLLLLIDLWQCWGTSLGMDILLGKKRDNQVKTHSTVDLPVYLLRDHVL